MARVELAPVKVTNRCQGAMEGAGVRLGEAMPNCGVLVMEG